MLANFSLAPPAFAPSALAAAPGRALLLAYLFVLGASIGSFVGLVVDRLPLQQSVIWPRSRCGGCLRALRPWELVPIASYLAVRGRCRRCGAAIGLRALWLELALAGLCCALAIRLGLGWDYFAWLPVVAVLVAIALLDIDYWWVPDLLSLPAIAWSFAASALPGRLGVGAALWGLLPAAGLWALASGYARISGKEGMGLGDIKILALCGLMLGPGSTLLMLSLASVQGSVVGGLVLATGGHRQRPGAIPPALADDPWQPPASAVPFGPFLALATLQVLLAPPQWQEGVQQLLATAAQIMSPLE